MTRNDQLGSESFLWLIGQLAHAQNAIRDKHLYIGHRMQRTTEMPAVVDKRIRDTAARRDQLRKLNS
jgi:hypothetical protein